MKRNLQVQHISEDSGEGYATLGIGTLLGMFGCVTDLRSSNEQTSPKKCERIVFAEACKINIMSGVISKPPIADMVNA